MHRPHLDGYDHSKHSVTDQNPHSLFLVEARGMSHLLTNQHPQETTRDALLEKLHRMIAALDDLWSRVEAGEFQVSSRALLRAARSVSCPEIGRRLRDPCPDHARISRDVRLLIKTFEYVIKPEPIP